MNDKRTVQAYTESVGHEPRNLPDDHPDVWQWLYRGTPEEKQRALSLLGLPNEDEAIVIDGQESLL